MLEMPPLSLDILAEICLLVVWLIYSKLTGAGFFHLKSIFHSFESINNSLRYCCLSRNMSYVVSNLGCIVLSSRPTSVFHLSHATFSLDCMPSPFTSYFLNRLRAPSLSTPLLQLLHTFLMQITVNLCQSSPQRISTPP